MIEFVLKTRWRVVITLDLKTRRRIVIAVLLKINYDL